MNLTVVGLGSRLGGDDAIGLLLVEALSESISKQNASCVLWENTDALTLALNLLDLSGPVVIVDCADMKMNAGSRRFFAGDSAEIKFHRSSVSTHGFGLAEALMLAEGLGFSHPVYFFGVQPFDLSPSIGLTDEMKSLFPDLFADLKKEVDLLIEKKEPREFHE